MRQSLNVVTDGMIVSGRYDDIKVLEGERCQDNIRSGILRDFPFNPVNLKIS